MANRIGLGGLAVLAWEVGVVGGLIFLFTRCPGRTIVPAVAIAIGVGAVYSLGMEYLVCGSGADHMVNLLGIGRGWSGARGSDYSHPEALAKRGDMEGAAKIYKEAIRMNRRDPCPTFGWHAYALGWASTKRPSTSYARPCRWRTSAPTKRLWFVRHIHEICSTQLEDRARAAPDLARYLERQPEGEHGEWARRELIYIKERIREDG